MRSNTNTGLINYPLVNNHQWKEYGLDSHLEDGRYLVLPELARPGLRVEPGRRRPQAPLFVTTLPAGGHSSPGHLWHRIRLSDDTQPVKGRFDQLHSSNHHLIQEMKWVRIIDEINALCLAMPKDDKAIHVGASV